LFQQSTDLDPTAFFVHIELGNLLPKRAARQEALREYVAALKYAPQDQLVRGHIEEQIARVSQQPVGEITPLRNPCLE
jgi:hypothetical protein